MISWSQGTGDTSIPRCPSCSEPEHGSAVCNTVGPQPTLWLLMQRGDVWMYKRHPILLGYERWP